MAYGIRRLLVIATALAILTPQARAELVVEEFRVPMAAAGPEGLEAILVKPDTPGRHPLALISHGSPRRSEERPALRIRGLLPELTEFARRGFAAAAVLRRGYGSSPGGWADSYGSCDHPAYAKAGRAGAQVHRAGGFATIALSADPPPGLVAAISFAGGRGSKGPDNVCHEEMLVDAFRTFGQRSRVPMLWLYARNDHFFNPALAQRLLGAFTEGGGRVEFVELEAFSREGHLLFTPAGRALWLPVVDTFLARHALREPAGLDQSRAARGAGSHTVPDPGAR